jgi:hypothetical protein
MKILLVSLKISPRKTIQVQLEGRTAWTQNSKSCVCIGGSFMKSLIIKIVLLQIPLLSTLHAAPRLQPGECSSDPDNKVYLASLKSGSALRFDRIRQEIGANRIDNLVDTDSRHHYFCRIQCADANIENNFIWVQMSDSVSRAMDMQGFLCPHVSIENVQIVGSIWGPQPVVKKFEAFTSPFFEVHDWLKNSGFQLSSLQAESRLAAAVLSFQQVGVAFINSNSPVLKTAGIQLLEISSLTNNGKRILLDNVRNLNQKNWEYEAQYSDSDYFVFNMLKTHARFLQYSDLNFLEESLSDAK